MDEYMLNILQKSLRMNLGGSFEVYEHTTVDEDKDLTIFQKFLEIITFHNYVPVPTKRFLVIRWFVNGYTDMVIYPEFAYDNICTDEEMGKFVIKVIANLTKRYVNRPKQTEKNKMEKTMKQEVEELKQEIARLQAVIAELETKTRTYPTETELYTNDLYNPDSYKTYPTHATNYEDYKK